MKPKYQHNREITELSKWSLPPICPDKIHWGYDHCLGKFAHKSRGKTYCLECGHSWKSEHDHKMQICPECLTKLETIKDYRTYCKDVAYMSAVTVCGGFQVVRMVWISKVMKMNAEADYFSKEVMQHWIDEDGNHTTMSLSVNGLSSACDAWVWSSEMKVKETRGGYNSTFRHNISPYKTFPKVQILPVFKRNGFKGDFNGVSPIEFFSSLLNKQQFETLLKAKQYSFLRLYSSDYIPSSVWSAIKICIRNKYIVKDARMWNDYFNLLQQFHLDTRNAFYVCPKNFKQAHDKLMDKRRKIRVRENLIRERENVIKRAEEAIKDQENYTKQKQKFFGIQFTDGKLIIKTLETVEEFMKEGDELHHCVFTNEYYKKPDSLVLSARIDNKPIETIEISLKTMNVVQSRGLQNKSSEYHDQIINLVRKNISVIQNKKSAKTLQKIAV